VTDWSRAAPPRLTVAPVFIGVTANDSPLYGRLVGPTELG
jgi:hypothetical protein